MSDNFVGVMHVTAEPFVFNGSDGYMVKYNHGEKNWLDKETFEHIFFPVESRDSLTEADVDSFVERGAKSLVKLGQKTTVGQVTLPTGWEEFAYNSCVDPDVYSLSFGDKVVTERVKDRIWELLGFVQQWAYHGLTDVQGEKELNSSLEEPFISEPGAACSGECTIHGFGWALCNMKLGRSVYRRSWKSQHRFVYLDLHTQSRVPEFFGGKSHPEKRKMVGDAGSTVDRLDVEHWEPSPDDLLAEDWDLYWVKPYKIA